jgi:hypothetical protein
MRATSRRNQEISEEMTDATLADSFPASDPPCWTLGRERYLLYIKTRTIIGT